MTKTILVVEDSALIALDLVMTLEEAGYVVAGVAATKDAALALAEAHAIDLATMDVELADGASGIDTAIALRTCYEIRSLFVSGSLSDALREEARRADPVGFLNKPVSPDEVIAAVNSYTRG